jgi:hypothetical protein
LISQIQTIEDTTGLEIVKGTRCYQFSCPSSPGNSGGPLVDARGEVLGVVDWQRTDAQNLNFAVPISYVLGLDTTLPTQPWAAVKTDMAAALPTMPVEHFSKDFKVPSKPPFDIAPLGDFIAISASPDSFVVSEKGKARTRASGDDAITPGQYFVTPQGVLEFNAADRGKTLTLGYDYQPHRIAVMTDDLVESIVGTKLQPLGDIPVSGPKVEAAIKEVVRGGMKLSDLAVQFGCSRVLVIAPDYLFDDARGLVTVSLKVLYEDVAGQKLIAAQGSQDAQAAGLLFGGPKRTQRDLAKALVADLVGL